MRTALHALFLSVLFPLAGFAEVAERGTLLHGGEDREYFAFVPRDADETTPLIFALHGMGGNAARLRFGIGLTEAAAQQGFAVVYPQGLMLPDGASVWNAGFEEGGADDLGYLSELARHLIDEHGLSPDRVMVMGISLGAYMTYHLACESDLPIAAIASIAGNMSASDWSGCEPGARVSLLQIHGTRDRVIRMDGQGGWAGQWGPSPDIRAVTRRWARSTQGLPEMPAIGLRVGRARVDRVRFVNTDNGTEVQRLLLREFGHDWPSAKTAGFQALEEIMRFFARHDGRDTDHHR